jgi:hypothetical protein
MPSIPALEMEELPDDGNPNLEQSIAIAAVASRSRPGSQNALRVLFHLVDFSLPLAVNLDLRICDPPLQESESVPARLAPKGINVKKAYQTFRTDPTDSFNVIALPIESRVE